MSKQIKSSRARGRWKHSDFIVFPEADHEEGELIVYLRIPIKDRIDGYREARFRCAGRSRPPKGVKDKFSGTDWSPDWDTYGQQITTLTPEYLQKWEDDHGQTITWREGYELGKVKKITT